MMYRRCVGVVVAAAVFAMGMAQFASAQIVPFKSTGTKNEYRPATEAFGGGGNTSHMGKTTGSGFARATPTDDPLVNDWTGKGEFVAANGDKIFFSGGGKVFLNPLGGTRFTARWVGEFNIDGGTGRFRNVGPGDAPLKVEAINDPFDVVNDPVWTYSYTITGTMDLGRRRR